MGQQPLTATIIQSGRQPSTAEDSAMNPTTDPSFPAPEIAPPTDPSAHVPPDRPSFAGEFLWWFMIVALAGGIFAMQLFVGTAPSTSPLSRLLRDPSPQPHVLGAYLPCPMAHKTNLASCERQSQFAAAQDPNGP